MNIELQLVVLVGETINDKVDIWRQQMAIIRSWWQVDLIWVHVVEGVE